MYTSYVQNIKGIKFLKWLREIFSMLFYASSDDPPPKGPNYIYRTDEKMRKKGIDDKWIHVVPERSKFLEGNSRLKQ